MIAIVDYGAGNLVSVKKALDWLGQESVITSEPEAISKSQKIILPGVGHFSSTGTLFRSGAQQAIENKVLGGTPFLGICVGMQWMFGGSEEAPETIGSGMFQGQCLRFPGTTKPPRRDTRRPRISPNTCVTITAWTAAPAMTRNAPCWAPSWAGRCLSLPLSALRFTISRNVWHSSSRSMRFRRMVRRGPSGMLVTVRTRSAAAPGAIIVSIPARRQDNSNSEHFAGSPDRRTRRGWAGSPDRQYASCSFLLYSTR